MEVLSSIEYFIEHVEEEGTSGGRDGLKQEIADVGGINHFWTEWILSKGNEEEMYACLEGVFEAISECWKLGKRDGRTT